MHILNGSFGLHTVGAQTIGVLGSVARARKSADELKDFLVVTFTGAELAMRRTASTTLGEEVAVRLGRCRGSVGPRGSHHRWPRHCGVWQVPVDGLQ